MSNSDRERLGQGSAPAAQSTPMTREESREYWRSAGLLILLSFILATPLAALLRLRQHPEAWHRFFTGSAGALLWMIALLPLLPFSVIAAKWLWRKARHGRYLPSSEEFQAFKARERGPQPVWRGAVLALIFGCEAVTSGSRMLHRPLTLNWNLVAAVFFAVATILFAWASIGTAMGRRRLARLPRREGFACPKCGAKPPIGPLWGCRACGKPFDTFATRTVCPNCSVRHETTMCVSCKASSPLENWERAASNPTAVLVNGVPLSM